MLILAMIFTRQVNFIKKNLSLSLFLFSLFILKAYSFYLLPVPNVFLSSHSLAKTILFSISGVFLLKNFRNIPLIISRNKTLFYLLLLYFIGQTLSIIPTRDIVLFFRFYHNVILYMIIFFLSYFFISKNQKLYKTFTSFVVFTGVVIVIFDFILLVFFRHLEPLFSTVIQKEIVDAYLYNVSNGKYAIVLGNELFLPFFLLLLFLKDGRTRNLLFFAVFSALIAFLSIFSNFRSRIIELLFSIIFTLSIFVFTRKTIIKSFVRLRFVTMLFIVVVMFSSIFYFAINTSNSINSFNIIDRLLLQDKYADLGPIDSRIGQARLSFDEFVSSPLFGVGLGNYSIYANTAPTRFTLQNKKHYIRDVVLASAERPHNIFFQLLGETGAIGLFTFSSLLMYFAFKDFEYFRSGKKDTGWAYIGSSWTLIVYAFFNPADTVYVVSWFWFFRGVIAAKKA